MMDDEQLWDEVRKQIANAPERNAPPGAWDSFSQQLPEVEPVKPTVWNSKFLLLLLPLAFVAGLFMQPDQVEHALSEVGFPLEKALEEVPVDQREEEALTATIQTVESSINGNDKNRSAIPTQQIDQLTDALVTIRKKVNSENLSGSVQSIGNLAPTPNRESNLREQTVSLELNKGEEPVTVKRSAKRIDFLPYLEPELVAGETDLAMAINTVIAKKPINAHQRIILATSFDTPFSGNQRPALHLSYRGNAWLGNLSWMAHLSHYRPRFGENIGAYGETDFNLTPYEEDNSIITAYGVEQEKLFAGIGLGYTFDVPSTRFSVYPFVSALYLILNNGEIQVDQFDEITETSKTTSYPYVNNDSSPNRYLLHGGVDVQYRVSRRWIGALSIQRNTTFAMEKAYWQFRAGVHYVLR